MAKESTRLLNQSSGLMRMFLGQTIPPRPIQHPFTTSADGPASIRRRITKLTV